jgi:iron complex outermembrane receptor protein
VTVRGCPSAPWARLVPWIALLAAAPCGAQRPAEIAGRVVDGVAGVSVDGARVDLIEAARATTTDAAGTFTLRGVDPGRHTVRIARPGYADTSVVVSAARGRVVSVWISLRPVPRALTGLSVLATPALDGIRMDRAAIERSGARTAGDVVAGVAGVVVRSTAAGGAETASIRGSGAAAVLVLVDGAAVNDPIDGVADLSRIAASTIESVTVLPGARSARYGARAEAGVIVIETRASSSTTLAAEAFGGSLGMRGGRVQAAATIPAEWTVGASLRQVRGAFDFALPREAGGGRARRTNADASAADAFASATVHIAGGELDLRTGADVLERGLPGKGFAPSASARESVGRARVSGRWERVASGGAVHALVAAAMQQARTRDDDPPFGPPYDDTARVRQLEVRLGGERRLPGQMLLGGGVDARIQSVHSTQLAAGAPADRWYGGLYAHGSAGVPAGRATLSFGAEARLDRDAGGGPPVASHALSASFRKTAASIQLAHRSSYSPPGLDDQFFRDAVGVEPNPDLQAERVPSEFELRATAAHAWAGLSASASLTGYVGDVRDMIVWAPDYRFVWSPRNVDVRRRGMEAAATLETARLVRTLRATYGYARVAYAAARDDAQLEYRPRHTAQLRGEWTWRRWSGGIDAQYTGERYPAAARVNALPGFWTVSADVARTWRAGEFAFATALHIDRLLDERATLIFGFPDPGRVAELRVRISRIVTPSTSNDP